jgi:hypothetical protein
MPASMTIRRDGLAIFNQIWGVNNMLTFFIVIPKILVDMLLSGMMKP